MAARVRSSTPNLLKTLLTCVFTSFDADEQLIGYFLIGFAFPIKISTSSSRAVSS